MKGQSMLHLSLLSGKKKLSQAPYQLTSLYILLTKTWTQWTLVAIREGRKVTHFLASFVLQMGSFIINESIRGYAEL